MRTRNKNQFLFGPVLIPYSSAIKFSNTSRTLHNQRQFLIIKAENSSYTSEGKVNLVMTFKVIITHPSIDDDEHTYYGIAFLNPGKVESGKLKYSASDDIKKVTLTFPGNPIEIGDKFLAILVPVNESEITNSTTPEFKIHENSPANVPEVVNF